MTPPCKDCITLAICRESIRGGDLIDILSLVDRCKLFKYYMYPPESRDIRKANEIMNTKFAELKTCLLENLNVNQNVNEENYEPYEN